MTFETFKEKYERQIDLGKKINELFNQTSPPQLLSNAVKEAEELGLSYENDSMFDAHWLIAPMSVEEAYKLHESQNV